MNRLLFTLALGCCLASLSRGPILAQPPGEPAERPLSAALAETSRLSCDGVPLREVIERLSKQHGVNIVFDMREIEQQDLQTPVRLRLEHASFETALSFALGRAGLSYVVGDGVIVVTARDRTRRTVAAAVYDVADLIPSADAHNPAVVVGAAEQLVEAIESTVAPVAWEVNGGPCSLNAVDRMLLVAASREVHGELAQFLDALRRARRLDAAGEPIPPDAVSTALGRSVDLRLHDASIDEAADCLRQISGLDLVVDERELRGPQSHRAAAETSDDPFGSAPGAIDPFGSAPGAIDPFAPKPQGKKTESLRRDVKLTIDLKDAPLDDALDEVLAPAGMGWYVRHNCLVLTTAEKASERLRTGVYRVRDLFHDRHSAKADDEFNLDRLLYVLCATVTPDEWEDVGGPASIAMYDGLLIVRHTEQGRRELADLFATLRTHGPAAAEHPQDVLQRKLRAKVSVDFRDLPLRDALRQLSEQHALQFTAKAEPLQASDLPLETRVTLKLSQAPLEIVLDLLLEEHDLTWIPRRRAIEVVVDGEESGYTHVYEVGDLAEPESGGGIPPQKLSELLVETVQRDSWEDVGGIGAIDVFQSRLIVYQTRRGHAAIESTLEQMRKIRRARREAKTEEQP